MWHIPFAKLAATLKSPCRMAKPDLLARYINNKSSHDKSMRSPFLLPRGGQVMAQEDDQVAGFGAR